MVELYRCPKCGHYNPPGREQCFLCKRDLDAPLPKPSRDEKAEKATGEAPASTPSVRRRKMPWGPILAVVLLVAVAGLLALFLLPGGGDEDGGSRARGLLGSSDTDPPALAEARPASGSVVEPGLLTIEGMANEPLAKASVAGTSAEINGDVFRVEVEVEPGPVRLAVSLTDEAGNEVSHELEYTAVAVPEGMELAEADSPYGPIFRSARAPGLRFVRIEGGTFRMGSEEGQSDERPIHEVTITRPYLLSRTETTNEAWAAYVEAEGAGRPGAAGFGGEYADYYESQPQGPVVQVSWTQADAFCSWLGGRLPTEAEWELAARGEDSLRYPWGDEDPCAGGTCRAVHEPRDDGFRWTSPVGTLEAGISPKGVYDMAGNVWEWTNDGFGNYPSGPVTDPRADGGRNKVLRGGSWTSTPGDIRSANRWNQPTSRTGNNIGFRCAMELE